MAFTVTDVVNKAVILGNLDTNDASLQERVQTSAEMIIAKADAYLGYPSTDVDALKPILAEITVTQITHYQSLRDTSTGATRRVTRGDYTVEYNAPTKDVFNEYEWILKKYKKLRTL